MTAYQRTDRMREVVVTGLGMVTPAGESAETSWKAVCDGTPTARHMEVLAGLPVDLACAVPSGFDAAARLGPLARRLDRFSQLAVAAAREAVADCGADPGDWDADRVGVVLGTGLAGVLTWEEQLGRLADAGPQFVSPLTIPRTCSNMAAALIAMDLKAHGPSMTVSTACASGTTAIGAALDLFRSGRCDVVLAGGAEAPITRLTTTAFERLGALSRNPRPEAASRPFDRDRDGFVLGEGAGVLVLETAEHARARRARPYAAVLGYGATSDAHHLTAPDPEGRAAEHALRLALADAGVTAADVDHVNAHATSTPHGDAAEAATLYRVFGERPVVTSTKGATGHLMAAAGAVEAAFTVLSVAHATVPPTANLRAVDDGVHIDVARTARSGPVRVAVSESFGFGGHNAALVVGAG